jgi:hypothetical protein
LLRKEERVSQQNKDLIRHLIKEAESTAIYVHLISQCKVKEEWSASGLMERVRELDEAS